MVTVFIEKVSADGQLTKISSTEYDTDNFWTLEEMVEEPLKIGAVDWDRDSKVAVFWQADRSYTRVRYC